MKNADPTTRAAIMKVIANLKVDVRRQVDTLKVIPATDHDNAVSLFNPALDSDHPSHVDPSDPAFPAVAAEFSQAKVAFKDLLTKEGWKATSKKLIGIFRGKVWGKKAKEGVIKELKKLDNELVEKVEAIKYDAVFFGQLKMAFREFSFEMEQNELDCLCTVTEIQEGRVNLKSVTANVANAFADKENKTSLKDLTSDFEGQLLQMKQNHADLEANYLKSQQTTKNQAVKLEQMKRLTNDLQEKLAKKK